MSWMSWGFYKGVVYTYGYENKFPQFMKFKPPILGNWLKHHKTFKFPFLFNFWQRRKKGSSNQRKYHRSDGGLIGAKFVFCASAASSKRLQTWSWRSTFRFLISGPCSIFIPTNANSSEYTQDRFLKTAAMKGLLKHESPDAAVNHRINFMLKRFWPKWRFDSDCVFYEIIDSQCLKCMQLLTVAFSKLFI